MELEGVPTEEGIIPAVGMGGDITTVGASGRETGTPGFCGRSW